MALDQEIVALGLDDALHRGQFLFSPLQARFPDFQQKSLRRFRRFGHVPFHLVRRMVFVAHQARGLGAQHRDLGEFVAVVRGAALAAARAVPLVHLFAQFAIVGVGHEALEGAAVETEHPGVRQLLLLRLGTGCAEHVVRQAGKIGLIGHDQFETVGFLQQVLAEHGGQFGQTGVDLLEALTRSSFQRGAAPHEIQVGQFEQPHLLFIQPQRLTLLVQRIDPRENLLVHVNRVPLTGQARGHLDVQFLQEIVGVGVVDVVEGVGHAPQGLPGYLERFDRVSEAGWFGVGANRGNLRAQLLDAPLEGRLEVLVTDAVERRNTVGRFPCLEKGIDVFRCGRHRCDRRPGRILGRRLF